MTIKNVSIIMVMSFAAISWMSATPNNPEKSLLSLNGFYPIMQMIYDFRFDDAEKLLDSKTGINAENKIARMNLLWWKAMTDSNNQMYFDELKDLSEHVLYDPPEIEDQETLENISRLTAGIYLIRIAAINDNKTAAFRTFLQILPNLKEILDDPFAYEEYTLLSGVYHYTIGSLKKHFYFLRPFFLLTPQTEIESGRQFLMLCSQSQNSAIATEARYFLFKIEKEIYGNLPLAEEHLNSMLYKHPENIVYRLELLNLYRETKRDSGKMENELLDLIRKSALHASQKDYLQSLVMVEP